MSEETNSTPVAQPKLTSEQERAAAIQAYHDAATREAKAAAVRKYPMLKTIYSDANHS